MHRTSTTVVLALATLLFVSVSSAQQAATTAVPNLIRYGGTLKDASGAPIAATTGVSFAIYKQQDGGAAVWMETQNVTTDASGNYSVLLGSTTATGLPSDLFSQQEQRWLGVQVQGQAEQPRVLLVSVPYAMKAAEADRLAGHSINEFVTSDKLQSAVQEQLQQHSNATTATSTATNANGKSGKAGGKTVPTDPATNFVDTTSDQVVSVIQNGSGKAIYAVAGDTSAIVGISGADAGVYGISTATAGQTAGIKASSSSPTGYGLLAFETATTGTGFSYGIFGTAASTLGVGIRGKATAASGTTIGIWGGSASTAGYGIKATADATSGNTVGLQAAVNSPTGTAALIQNLANGPISGYLLKAGTKTDTQFTIDAAGNIGTKGGFNGAGNVRGQQLISSVARGTPPLVVASTTQVPDLNASLLGGSAASAFAPASGSTHYIQNGTSPQSGANFNIAGMGTVGGALSGNSVNTATTYGIGGSTVLSISTPGDDGEASVSLGVGAGTAGGNNTFIGSAAGHSITRGGENTFIGWRAGYGNTDGSANVFIGEWAGYKSSGSSNIFLGSVAGANNAGYNNIFIGAAAGSFNTEGGFNTFIGSAAGNNNTTGGGNIFSGSNSGMNNTTGSFNVFSGYNSGGYNTTGRNNIFNGSNSGMNNTSGNNNIYIGSPGCTSYPCTESDTIRIGGDVGSGDGTQTAAYMAGIYGTTSSGGIPVYINSSGQLGTLTSSLRFKEQIRDMDDSTNALMKLRPVTFLYKPEYDKGQRTLQYGLIAEEVAKVYPDMVAYDKDGAPYTVKYQYLAPMLLNELQKQHTVVAAQQGVIKAQQEQMQTQGQQIADLQQRLSRLESLIARK